MPRWVHRHLPRCFASRIAKRYTKQRGSLLWTTGTTRNTANGITSSGLNLLRPSDQSYSAVDTGRIRMARVEDASAESLIPFVQTAVCPGATIRTDGWRAYNGLTGVGFEHQPKNISASGDPAHIVMPQVHRVAGLLDRWWLGIHHGAISASQLDYYLDEFTFRFNRRRSKARGLLFYRLLQQAVQLEPVPYKKLVGGRPSPAPQDLGTTRANRIFYIRNCSIQNFTIDLAGTEYETCLDRLV